MPWDTGKEDSSLPDGSQENILESVDGATAAATPTMLTYKQRAIRVMTEMKIESKPAAEDCCLGYYNA